MTNTTVQVPVGSSATMISSGLPAGSTVFNTDTADSIWVSSSPSLTVGAGIQLTALGSATWSGGPVYAICNTGVTSPVMVNLSTDANNYQNPVAIGTAVSQQLLNNGVPNVITGSTVTNANLTQPFDVSSYASVSGSLNINASSGTLSLVFYDPTQTIIVYHKAYTFAGPWAGFQFSTPVYGPYMQISYANGGADNLQLYGSNRLLPERCYTQQGNSDSKNLTFPNGVTLLNSSTLVTNGGPASINVRCTPPLQTAGGDVAIQFWDTLANQISTMQICNTTQMSKDEAGNYSYTTNGLILPAGGFNIQWFNNGAATAGTALYGIMYN